MTKCISDTDLLRILICSKRCPPGGVIAGGSTSRRFNGACFDAGRSRIFFIFGNVQYSDLGFKMKSVAVRLEIELEDW